MGAVALSAAWSSFASADEPKPVLKPAPVAKGRAQPENEQLKPADAAPIRKASAFVGSELQASDGKPLGKIEDLIVDLDNGAVVLLVARPDAGLDLGTERMLVPPGCCSDATQDEATKLRVTRDQVHKAPRIADLKQLTRDDVAKVYAHFDQMPAEPKTIPDPHTLAGLTPLSTLRGMAVENAKGVRLGTIRDFALVGDGRIAYVGMSSEANPKQLYPVPLSAFVVPEGAKTWMVELPKGILENTPTFSEAVWPKTIDRAWSEYVNVRYGNSVFGGVNRETKAGGDQPKAP